MAKWKLDPKDVSVGGSMSTTGTPGGKTGPRLRGADMTMYHLPTDVSVPLVIKPFVTSKDGWRKAYDMAWDKAFLALEAKVAKHLKIKGR